MVLTTLTATAQQEGLDANTRFNSDQHFAVEIRDLELRAEDYQQRKQAERRYDKEINSHKEDYKKKKKAEEEWYERARKAYVEYKKSEEVIDLESLRPAWEEKIRREERQAERLRQKFSREQEVIRRAREKGEDLIPPDEELGLDYKKI